MAAALRRARTILWAVTVLPLGVAACALLASVEER